MFSMKVEAGAIAAARSDCTVSTKISVVDPKLFVTDLDPTFQ
jgi:hypothetical protein